MATYDEIIQGLASFTRNELPSVSVKRFGAKGDNSTDDTTAIQNTINYVSSKFGGGVVQFPPGVYKTTAMLTAKSGVTLRAHGGNYQYIGGGSSNTVISANGSLQAIIGSTSDVQAFSIDGLALNGNGTVTTGVDLSGAYWCALRNMNVFGTTGRYIWVRGGFNTRIQHGLYTNGGSGLTNATGYVGLIELAGSDHMVEDQEISYNNGSKAPSSYSSGMYVSGLMISAANCMVTGSVVAEFCETGIVVTGDHNKFSANRADNNWGNGWVVNGTGNLFSACGSYENGKRTSNTYDGFQVNGAGNEFAACKDWASTGKLKYGFHDTVSQSSSIRNNYASCTSVNALTAPFYGDSYLGSSPAQSGHIGHISSASSGVIDATGLRHIHLDFSATTITKITGGYAGKEIVLFSGAAQVLADNNAIDGFYFGSGNVTLTPNVGLHLFYDNNKWLIASSNAASSGTTATMSTTVSDADLAV